MRLMLSMEQGFLPKEAMAEKHRGLIGMMKGNYILPTASTHTHICARRYLITAIKLHSY